MLLLSPADQVLIGPYKKALTDTVMQIRSSIVFCWGIFYRFAEKAAGISGKIPILFLSGILHWAIFVIVNVIICFIILGPIIIVIRLIWRRFHNRMKLCLVMLWASGIVAISACFGDQMQALWPINIVYCDLCLWAVAYIGSVCMCSFVCGKKWY